MTRIVRAALTGLGAFVSELIPAQAVSDADTINRLSHGVLLHQGLDEFAAGEGVSSDWLFEPGCDGKCAHDECVCPDPAAPDAAAPSPEPPTGDTEPAGVKSPVAPAGSTNELAADLVYAAGVVRAYAVVTPDLHPREVTSLNALSERLAAASKAAQ